MKTKVLLKSKISGREILVRVSARSLLETSEEDLVETITECDCTQLHEYGYGPCECDAEWEEYDLFIGEEIEDYRRGK